MALCLRQLSARALAPSSARCEQRRTLCRYRHADSEHRDEQWVCYTTEDAAHGGLAPESAAVLAALLEKGVAFREMKVAAGGKPAELAELYHSIIPDKDVRERMPVLVHGSKRLVDHAVIVEYLAHALPDVGTPLVPMDPYAAARVRLFTGYFLEHVVPAFNRLIHASSGAVGEAKEGLLKALAAVDEFLALHGSGEGDYAVGPHWSWNMKGPEQQSADDAQPPAAHEHYLMGPFYTTAEVMCTPYITRMVHTLPEWRGLDVLQECEQRQLARVAGWMRACLARPSAQKTAPNATELVGGMAAWEWSHSQ